MSSAAFWNNKTEKKKDNETKFRLAGEHTDTLVVAVWLYCRVLSRPEEEHRRRRRRRRRHIAQSVGGATSGIERAHTHTRTHKQRRKA